MENFASARFLLPIMVVFIVVILIPFLQSLVFSFTDYSGYNFADAKFVGFANYVQCFKDPTLLAGLGFTLLYTVATTVLITVIALPLAVVLNRKFFGRNFARSLFFFFSVPSMAVLGLVWQYIFSPLKSGVVNTLLAKIGIVVCAIQKLGLESDQQRLIQARRPEETFPRCFCFYGIAPAE